MRLTEKQGEALGAKVQAYIAEHQLSNSEVNRRTGLNMDFIAKALNGATRVVPKKTRAILETMLAMPFNQIIGSGNGSQRAAEAQEAFGTAGAGGMFTLTMNGTELVIPAGGRITVLGPSAVRIE